MKKIIAVILCMVLVLAALPASAVQARFFRDDGNREFHMDHLRLHIGSKNCKASGNYLQVRTTAGGNNVVGHLEIADIFTLDAINGHWAQITVLYSAKTSPDSFIGLTGWVDADYIECPCSAPDYYANTPPLTYSLAVTNQKNTTIRERTAKSSRSFAKLKAGEQVEIISEYTGDDNRIWYRVRYNNIMGYIRSDLVTVTQRGLPEDLSGAPENPASPVVIPEGDTWEAAYRAFLENRVCDQIGYPDYMPDGYDFSMTGDGDELTYVGYDYDPIWFTIYDLDNNGIPELILYNGMGVEAGNCCHVYTFRNRQPDYLGTIGRRDLLWVWSADRTYPGLFQTDGNMGYYLTDYWTLRNGQLVCETIESISYYTDPDSDFPTETDNPIITRETNDLNLYNWYKNTSFRDLVHWDYETLNRLGWQAFMNAVWYGGN